MKTINHLIICISISCLFLVSLQSVVHGDSLNKIEALSQFENLMSQSNFELNDFSGNDQEHPLWFPGFLIVQLLKGVMAFILVLLILFDIIEPTN